LYDQDICNQMAVKGLSNFCIKDGYRLDRANLQQSDGERSHAAPEQLVDAGLDHPSGR
jgi:hypothetical protein